MNVTVSGLREKPDDVERLSSLLHDARVLSVTLADGTVRIVIQRAGYEHGYQLSKGWWIFGGRWMYPWVECALTIEPVAGADEKRTVEGTEDFDDVMSLRLSGQKLIVHRAFSHVSVALLPESVLRVEDTGKDLDRTLGMIMHSSKPLDLSVIEPLLR